MNRSPGSIFAEAALAGFVACDEAPPPGDDAEAKAEAKASADAEARARAQAGTTRVP